MDTTIGWRQANPPSEINEKQACDLAEQASLPTPAPTPTNTFVFDFQQLLATESVLNSDILEDDLEITPPPSSQRRLPSWIKSLFIDRATHLADEIGKTNKLREDAAKKERKRVRDINAENKRTAQGQKTQQQEKTDTKNAKQLLEEVEISRGVGGVPVTDIEREQIDEITIGPKAKFVQSKRSREFQQAQIRDMYIEKYSIHRFGQLSGGGDSEAD